MAICGHQFQGGDESDWILSTSAGCLDGSTTANQILQELFRKHCRKMPSKTVRKRPITVIPSIENKLNSLSEPRTNVKTKSQNPKNENLIVKRITGPKCLENFDESQHLNGCPLKWLYNKKMLEKNKVYKIGRLCNKKSDKKEQVKKEKTKNLRDKTPMEVKIHKINLLEKYTTNSDDTYSPFLVFPPGKFESKDIENHRKKLAAKLNWKLHDESQEDCSIETASEISSRSNYLPPRPLLGLKPLLSVLLAPQQETNCCSLLTLQGITNKKKSGKASLTIQSLNLPIEPLEPKKRPKTTNTLRWGTKSSFLAKKLQIPNQITLKLDEQTKPLQNHFKVVYYNPPTKKTNEKLNQSKPTLSSLYYELKGKTNYRERNEKYFEEMIQDLTMEDDQYKIRRFLNFNFPSLSSDRSYTRGSDKRKKCVDVCDESELSVICENVTIHEKKPTKRN